MKVQFASDLHLDCREHIELDAGSVIGRLAYCKRDARVLVLGGDTAELRDPWSWLGWLSQMRKHWDEIVVVPGNHEYYGLDRGEANHLMGRLMESVEGVNFIEDGLHPVLGSADYLIGGSVLWYEDHPLTRAMESGINDFTEIVDCSDWVYEAGRVSRAWAQDETLEKCSLMVTHVPTDSRLLDRPPTGLSRFYFHQLDSWKRAPVWASGHTHLAFDRELPTNDAEKRFVSNALGYPGEPCERHFNWSLLLDLEPAVN